MSDINIEYWFDGEKLALITKKHVPRIGDLVQLTVGLYQVNSVCWVHDINHIDNVVQIGIEDSE